MHNARISKGNFVLRSRTSHRSAALASNDGALSCALRLSLLIVACALPGCKSHSPSQYISPRVEGRVLDIQTHQPIKDVQVRRITADQSYQIDDPPKGGQLMQKTAGVRSASDGTFVLESERDVALFQTLGWYSVSIAFQHPAYVGFRATYTVTEATNTAQGEPLIKTGDILLILRAK
jgi:hypothetical protein